MIDLCDVCSLSVFRCFSALCDVFFLSVEKLLKFSFRYLIVLASIIFGNYLNILLQVGYCAPECCDRTIHAVHLRPNSTFARSRSQGCVGLGRREMQIQSNKYVLIPLMSSVARFNGKRVNLPQSCFIGGKKL